MSAEQTAKSPTPGELLRQGRLRQRLSISECAKRTHIAPRYLEALEEDRWKDLPSESHRLGFLRLYSRFLGVPAEDLLDQYRKEKDAEVPDVSAAAPARQTKPEENRPSGLFPPSGIQLVGLLIFLLAAAWGVYHAVRDRLPDASLVDPSATAVSGTQASRLVTTKQSVTTHKIRVQAQQDCWMRVTGGNRLLYEGILRGGGTKEWSGVGPFLLRVANVRALQVFWNDQPVDVGTGSRSGVSDIQLPPSK